MRIGLQIGDQSIIPLGDGFDPYGAAPEVPVNVPFLTAVGTDVNHAADLVQECVRLSTPFL